MLFPRSQPSHGGSGWVVLEGARRGMRVWECSAAAAGWQEGCGQPGHFPVFLTWEGQAHPSERSSLVRSSPRIPCPHVDNHCIIRSQVPSLCPHYTFTPTGFCDYHTGLPGAGMMTAPTAQERRLRPPHGGCYPRGYWLNILQCSWLASISGCDQEETSGERQISGAGEVGRAGLRFGIWTDRKQEAL